MRLRYLLPVLQIVFSIAFVFIPTWRFLPHYRVRGPDGVEIVCHDNCLEPGVFGIDSDKFAEAMNLPAAIVVFPILAEVWDYSEDGHDYFHDSVLHGISFAIVGIALWYFAGRSLDDVMEWRHTGVRPELRITDCLFSATAVSVATLSILGLQWPRNPAMLWRMCGVALWIVIGYASVALRGLQIARARREASGVDRLS